MDFRKNFFMESVIMDSKKVIKKIDRIIIDTNNMIILNNIINQIRNELGDFISINPKVIGNFILKNRSYSLSKEEMELLKIENHDIIKALKKATQEAIRLRQNGLQIDYENIKEIIRTASVIEKRSETVPRQQKKKAITEKTNTNAIDSASVEDKKATA